MEETLPLQVLGGHIIHARLELCYDAAIWWW